MAVMSSRARATEANKAASSKVAPAKATPSKATPSKTAQTKVTPRKAAPVKAETPAKAVTPQKAVPTKSAPSTPAKAAAAKTATPAKRTRSAAATQEDADPAMQWTGHELAEVRGELVGSLDEMQDEYDRSMNELNALHQTGTDGAGDDQADAGSKTFEREQELSIAANRLDLLNQIQRAIERVDAGTYGLCESCGNPIPKARLKAFPMATLDVACKQREERR
jgi:RNA polymerase-binding protein DksA